jgi:hypothetical protein
MVNLLSKELPKEFIGRGEVKGFRFRQLERTEEAFLYEVTKPGDIIHYEVVFPMWDHRLNRWLYPKSKSWGNFGWKSTNYERAKKRLLDTTELVKSRRKRLHRV